MYTETDTPPEAKRGSEDDGSGVELRQGKDSSGIATQGEREREKVKRVRGTDGGAEGRGSFKRP